jgi:DNA polymerase-3 subunit gamma/tau
MLGTLGGDLVWPLLERIAAGDGQGAIAEAERIAGRGVAYEAALEELAAILHRIAMAQAGAEPSADDPDAARIADMAARLDAGTLQVFYQVAVVGRRDLALAPDEYAGFTMTVLRMLSFVSRHSGSQAARASSSAGPTRAAPPRPAAAGQPPATRAATAPARAPAPAAIGFDGDWPALVERLNLTGLAGMVARHGELAAFDNGHFELVVPESHKMYAEKAYQDKLKAELSQHFGAGVRLTVRVGATAGRSVAAARSRDEARRQANAAEAIEDDPFVRELVRDLGAEVVSSSIRPADDAAGPTNER